MWCGVGLRTGGDKAEANTTIVAGYNKVCSNVRRSPSLLD